jgi:hypothetical protein
MSALQPWSERRKNQVTVPASYDTCGDPRGFTNLLVTKLPDGRIQFDPHATGFARSRWRKTPPGR